MFKVNCKNGACLVIGVCGPMTVINAGCCNKDVAWDKDGITKWLKGKVTLKDTSKKDDNDKALGDLAENIASGSDIDEAKVTAVNELYKCSNAIDTHILKGDKGLVDAGKDPDKKKYGEKDAYKVTGNKDGNISVEKVKIPKE